MASSDVTQLLQYRREGNADALEALMPLVHAELRYFAGLTIEETAEVLGISTVTVKRQWTFAGAWLQQQLSEGDP